MVTHQTARFTTNRHILLKIATAGQLQLAVDAPLHGRIAPAIIWARAIEVFVKDLNRGNAAYSEKVPIVAGVGVGASHLVSAEEFIPVRTFSISMWFDGAHSHRIADSQKTALVDCGADCCVHSPPLVPWIWGQNSHGMLLQNPFTCLAALIASRRSSM